MKSSCRPSLWAGPCVLLVCGAALATEPATPDAQARTAQAQGRSVSIVELEHSQIVTSASGPGAVAETRIGDGQVRARSRGRAVVIINGRVVQSGESDAPTCSGRSAACPDASADRGHGE